MKAQKVQIRWAGEAINHGRWGEAHGDWRESNDLVTFMNDQQIRASALDGRDDYRNMRLQARFVTQPLDLPVGPVAYETVRGLMEHGRFVRQYADEQLNGVFVLAGNPIDGVSLYGPFPDGEAANEWGERSRDEWHLIMLESPGDGSLWKR